ncbi:hypothetical protein RAB80_008876 [Fusarium oxysporum f. sp. vasinfectum]|nr:hypothetical protein RAB80_008876 [Fusarium oxysporum f. sp. vasinfectum]
MHLLSGVGGSCESTERLNNVPRRDSSISLEESAYKQDNPEPTRTPLVPLESQKIEDCHDPNPGHGCTLPIPSPSSSPSVPTQCPKATNLQPTTTDPDIEDVDRMSVDSKYVSDLLLSDASHAASDSADSHKEAIIQYQNAPKRARREDRARIHKNLKKRTNKKKKVKSKSV